MESRAGDSTHERPGQKSSFPISGCCGGTRVEKRRFDSPPFLIHSAAEDNDFKHCTRSDFSCALSHWLKDTCHTEPLWTEPGWEMHTGPLS